MPISTKWMVAAKRSLKRMREIVPFSPQLLAATAITQALLAIAAAIRELKD